MCFIIHDGHEVKCEMFSCIYSMLQVSLVEHLRFTVLCCLTFLRAKVLCHYRLLMCFLGCLISLMESMHHN